MPVSSNVAGADINAPTTLIQEFESTLAVNDVNSDVSTSAGLPISQMEPIPQPTPQSEPAPLGESFKNINKLKSKSKSNLANFISSKEHFGNKNSKKVRVIEHFSKNSILDNIVLLIIIAVGVFYLYTLSPVYHPLDVSMAVSQIPLIGSLTDSGVSDNNKLMIVAGILIAVVVIYRLVK
jgi:hypothetical protein